MSRSTFFRFGIAAIVALMCVRLTAQETTPEGAADPISTKSRHFTENNGRVYDTEGRLRDDILYTASTGNARVFFGKDRVSYVLIKSDARIPSLQEMAASGKPMTHAARLRPEINNVELYRVDLEFSGGNSDVAVHAGERANSVAKFYNVSGSANAVEASEFGTVTYSNVYDNIDIVFRLDKGSLKYDFVVRPGGRVGDIHLRYNGAEKVEVGKDGVLSVYTPIGVITENIPAAFALGADERKKDVEVVFHRRNDNTIGFYHDRYDEAQSLVIDPAVEVSTYFGGSNLEGIINMGRQGTGYSFYATGYTYSIDFPASVGAYQTSNAGNMDAFIFKFDEDGNRLWATYYGGTADDDAADITFDTNNDFVLVGKTKSTNLPGVPLTAFQPNHSAGVQYDAFIAKFNSGGSLLWATYYGGTNDDEASGIYINGTLQIFVVGHTISPTAGAGAFPVNIAVPPGLAGYDGFILKFTSAGGRTFARRFGGNGDDFVTEMTSKNVDMVVVGNTTTAGPTFSPSTASALQTTNAGDYDIFVSKFNNLNLAPVRTTFFGGSDLDALPFISWDNRLESTVSFTTFSTNVPTTLTAMQSSNAGAGDAFIAVLGYALDNTSLMHATYFGGSNTEEGRGVVQNGYFGVTFLTGSTNSTDLPATTPPLFPSHSNLCAPSDIDAFLLQLSPEYQLLSSQYFGGCGDDYGQQIMTGPCEKCVYIVGTTLSNDFLTTPNAFQDTYAGGGDGFMLRINVEPNMVIKAAAPLTIQTGGGVGLFVVPAPIYSMFSSVQWHRNGQPIPGATMTHYLATKPGRYYLVGNSLNPACSTHYSNVLEVKYNCLDSKIDYASYPSGYVFPVGMTTISTTASYNGYAFGTVVVPAGATVNILNTTILAQPCAEIIVQPGGILNVTNSTIQGCDDWHGITVQGNPGLPWSSGVQGELHIDNSTISDADVAVYSVDGGYADVENSIFFDNRHCIALDPYIFPQESVLFNNWFDDPNTDAYVCFTPPFAAAERAMVHLDGVNGMPIDLNEFYGDFFNPATSPVIGVKAHNSSLIHIFDNIFDGALHTAMSFTTTNAITVRFNKVGKNLAMHPENGIVFSQSFDDIIDLNRLYRCRNGMQYYTMANGPITLVDRNLFEGGNFGLVISTNEHPVNAPLGANSAGNLLNFNLYCNKFVDNWVGIIGSGDLTTQGSLADEANNMFFQNRNWDLLWQGAAGSSFYQGSTVNPSLPLNIGFTPAYVMNGINQAVNNLSVVLNTSSGSTCRGTWIITSAQEPTQSDETIRLYPNPFADELTVELNGGSGAVYTVEIVDMFGRSVYSAELNAAGSTHLAPKVPVSGVYMVRIYKNGEEIRSIPAVNIGR